MAEQKNLQPSRRAMMKTAAAGLATFGTPLAVNSAKAAPAPRDKQAGNPHADQFLRDYDAEFQKLYTAAGKAQWLSSTDVSDAHSEAATAAQQELNKFVGAPERMEQIKALRGAAWKLDPITVKQLDRAWMAAAHAPGNIPDLVAQRTEAETKQSQIQNSFEYKMRMPEGGEKIVGANDIDEILAKSDHLDERLAAWNASKEIGVALKDGLANVRDLRNAVSRGLGFNSYFHLEVADYGMPVSEMMSLMKTVLEQTRPFFEQLHCWTKHELAKRYNAPVPKRRIPAHWLPNRWGQEWNGIVSAVDLDPLFTDKSPEWIIEQAEKFYMSMGFPKLPQAFWDKSDLYELPPDAERKKNRHASAWHIDLDHDVRSLMSVQPNAQWFSTTHHELGHIYYFLAYTDSGCPLLLREGANRAFHEGVGDLITLASKQKPYLVEIGVMPADFGKGQETEYLLSQAIDGNLVFLPFSCGVMTGFEHDLYEKPLAKSEFNKRWWELKQQYQGIDPPNGERGEQYCDAASKTHINDDPAQYYDYAIGTLFVYQVHDYIARNILKQDPRNCNYYGRKDVGEYLAAMLELGATRDWRQVLRDFTGEDLSARAMLAYYEPLMGWLQEQNKGRDVSFA